MKQTKCITSWYHVWNINMTYVFPATIFHVGPLWISRASKASNTSCLYFQIRSSCFKLCPVATRKIFSTFWEIFAGMLEPHLLFFFSVFLCFHQWTKIRIDFPRPRVMHGRYHMFGEWAVSITSDIVLLGISYYLYLRT